MREWLVLRELHSHRALHRACGVGQILVLKNSCLRRLQVLSSLLMLVRLMDFLVPPDPLGLSLRPLLDHAISFILAEVSNLELLEVFTRGLLHHNKVILHKLILLWRLVWRWRNFNRHLLLSF